jgi:hypothetical protein
VVSFWRRRPPPFSLALSPAPAFVSIVGGLLRGAACVRYATDQGFPRLTAVHLPAPLQPPGQAWQKEGRSRGSCKGIGFFSPPSPLPRSRVGVPEALLPAEPFLEAVW